MILQRLIKNTAEQNWFVVFIELVVVFVGIYLGIQATNWDEERKSRADGYYYLDLLQRQLDAEIQVSEEVVAGLSDRVDQLRSAFKLLYADSWSEDEYAQFKSDHLAAYRSPPPPRRPSALRQLVDAGKIDLVESRAMQEMLFDLDNAYEGALFQTGAYERFVSEAATVLTKAIPYGTGDELLAIPVGPDVLLQSKELKWSIRLILTCARKY